MLKKFVATIFAATLFANSAVQASAEDLMLEDPLASEGFNDRFLNKYPVNNPENNPENNSEENPEENFSNENSETEDIPNSTKDEKPVEIVETPPPQVEGEGLEFHVYHKNGVMAFAVIADHERYTLRHILAKDQISGRETVSQMTADLADIAMINAGYFMKNGSLIGVEKIDGEIIAKDDFYRSAIGISEDGAVIFGRVRYNGEIEYYGETFPIYGVNCERGENSLVLYNSYFGATTGTNDFGVEVVVEDGMITNIFYDKGNNAIPAGGYVISAHGTAADFLKTMHVYDMVNINQQIISEDGNFNDMPNVIGAGPRLVMDGKVFVTADAEQFPKDIRVGRAPRSAIGVNQYGDYIFAVVDGRQAHSKGCTLQEWAEILLNDFGAVNAINLDGGGSTELIVKDQLVNKPSDGKERAVGSALAIIPR